MNITLRLEGIPEEIIEEMIKAGVAATKTEAIRIALLDYISHHSLKRKNNKENEDNDYSRLQSTGWNEYLKDEKEDLVLNKYL